MEGGRGGGEGEGERGEKEVDECLRNRFIRLPAAFLKLDMGHEPQRHASGSVTTVTGDVGAQISKNRMRQEDF